MSCEACCLVRVGVGGSDSSHKADLSFHGISKVPRILDTSTVMILGIDKRVNKAHHHDSILEASQEHLGDRHVGDGFFVEEKWPVSQKI